MTLQWGFFIVGVYADDLTIGCHGRMFLNFYSTFRLVAVNFIDAIRFATFGNFTPKKKSLSIFLHFQTSTLK